MKVRHFLLALAVSTQLTSCSWLRPTKTKVAIGSIVAVIVVCLYKAGTEETVTNSMPKQNKETSEEAIHKKKASRINPNQDKKTTYQTQPTKKQFQSEADNTAIDNTHNNEEGRQTLHNEAIHRYHHTVSPSYNFFNQFCQTSKHNLVQEDQEDEPGEGYESPTNDPHEDHFLNGVYTSLLKQGDYIVSDTEDGVTPPKVYSDDYTTGTDFEYNNGSEEETGSQVTN